MADCLIGSYLLELQGLGASVLGAIPYSAIRLGSYDGLKWAYKKVRRAAPASCLRLYQSCPMLDMNIEGACGDTSEVLCAMLHFSYIGLNFNH